MLGTDFFMELHGNQRLLIDGCDSLVEYSDTEIKVTLNKKALRICGELLQMYTFCDGRLGISGKINQINIE